MNRKPEIQKVKGTIGKGFFKTIIFLVILLQEFLYCITKICWSPINLLKEIKLFCNFHHTKNNYTFYDNNMLMLQQIRLGFFYYSYDILHFPEELLFITIMSCTLPNLFGGNIFPPLKWNSLLDWESTFWAETIGACSTTPWVSFSPSRKACKAYVVLIRSFEWLHLSF